MKSTWRFILRLFITIIFLAIVTIFLIIAKGLKYDPIKGELVQTGVLEIDPFPNNTAVFINDDYAGFSPLEMRNFPINQTKIRLEKSNYLPWEKEIKIDKRMVTKVRPLLIEKKIEDKIEKIALKDNVFVEDENRKTVILYDNLKMLYVIDFEKEEENFIYLANNLEKVEFDVSGDLIIKTKEDTFLNNFYKNDKSKPTPSLKEQARVSENGLFLLLMRDNKLWKYSFSAKEAVLIEEFDSNLNDAFWFPETNSIIAVTKNKIYVLDSDGKNIFLLFNKHADTDVFFLKDKKRLFWFEDEYLKSVKFE